MKADISLRVVHTEPGIKRIRCRLCKNGRGHFYLILKINNGDFVKNELFANL